MCPVTAQRASLRTEHSNESQIPVCPSARAVPGPERGSRPQFPNGRSAAQARLSMAARANSASIDRRDYECSPGRPDPPSQRAPAGALRWLRRSGNPLAGPTTDSVRSPAASLLASTKMFSTNRTPIIAPAHLDDRFDECFAHVNRRAGRTARSRQTGAV
jgi:hypothetical protein